jgi:hypothetical protein
MHRTITLSEPLSPAVARTPIEEAELSLRCVARQLDRAARHGIDVREAMQTALALQEQLLAIRCGPWED